MTDSILIIGGGFAGLAAALRCADAGANAIVVERAPIVGGKLSAGITDKSSLGATIDGQPVPKISALEENERIEIFTLAGIASLDGAPGNFDVSIRERARFVTDACTRCNNCRPVCPEVLPNEYEAGLSYRKAIYTPHIETLPQEFVIDIDACLNTPPNYLPCNRCIDVCDDDAIHFDVALEQHHERKVAAAIVAVGDEFVGIGETSAIGYGESPDVVTATELECLLTAPGPTGGFVSRPSNEDYPDSILVVLDDLANVPVSRTASQLRRLVEQNIERIVLLVTVNPGGDEKDALLNALPAGLDARYGLLQKVECGDENRLRVTYADFVSNEVPEETFDLVVLGAETRPRSGLDELAASLGIDLDSSGFVARRGEGPACDTSRDGVYVAGGAAGAATPAATFEQATAAASVALSRLDPRLLKKPVPGDAASGTAAASSEAELRARIEHALFAMLDSGD